MEVTTANGQGNLIERDVDHMYPYADGVSMTENPKIPGSVLPQVQQVFFHHLSWVYWIHLTLRHPSC